MKNPDTTLTLDEFRVMMKGHPTVLVDFYATWCEPCAWLDEILKELEGLVGDKVEIIKLDVDRQQELSRALSVRSVPTLMIYKEGVMKWRMAGFKLAHELAEELENC